MLMWWGMGGGERWCTSCNLLFLKGNFFSFQMHLYPYYSVVGVNSYVALNRDHIFGWSLLLKMKDGQCIVLCFYCNKRYNGIHSNAENGPTHFDHSSLNREQLLAPTMKWYGLKCIWKLMKFPFQWHIMEHDTIYTFYRDIKNAIDSFDTKCMRGPNVYYTY